MPGPRRMLRELTMISAWAVEDFVGAVGVGVGVDDKSERSEIINGVRVGVGLG